MSLGKLKETVLEGRRSIVGYLATYLLYLDFNLEPVDRRQSDKSPTHNIIARGKHGGAFCAGKAWEGRTRDQSERMYSLKFSVPEIWGEEFDVMAWDDRNGGFDLVPSRKEDQAVAA